VQNFRIKGFAHACEKQRKENEEHSSDWMVMNLTSEENLANSVKLLDSRDEE
jgi:hypothetical protein